MKQLIELYKERLNSLEQTIKNMYIILKDDESLGILKDENMQRYRIQRINQICLRIMNDEKEQMLIRVL